MNRPRVVKSDPYVKIDPSLCLVLFDSGRNDLPVLSTQPNPQATGW